MTAMTVLERVRSIPLNGTTILAVLALLSAAAFVYLVFTFVYNLYFHPLARFPGPLLWRATRLMYVIRMNQGELAFDVLGLHEKYGSIVRIAPNELSFQEPQAWKDIYGHRTGSAHGAEEMDKYHTFYRTKGEVLSISSGDREYHGRLRRQLAHGFSERALREQETIIGSYAELLIKRLNEARLDPDKVDPVTGEPAKRALDIKEWYNWTTFDVIGDLTFGAPFGSLERAKSDPWVEAINGSIRFLGIINGVKHMGLESAFIWLVKLLNTSRSEHDRKMMDRLHRRVEMKMERPDIIEGLLKKKDEWGLSMHHLQANSSSVLIAGSETTSSMLSGVTYLLLRNPEALRKVTEEVRSSFRSEEDITLTSVSCLTYMLACLNEALRSYPPVPFGMPRQVPKGGGTILGEFIPEDTVVAVWHWASYHSSKHFTKPFEYHPERFLGDPEFSKDGFDMLQPFSQGPRNCIGRHLAYAEMRLVLARMLWNFDISLVGGEANERWIHHKSYVLWDKPPLYVYLTPKPK
ncbi:putative cytochrome P450 [Durotheca rogersii]|uniref:putative cytochrome P450 n=1 Tax=Durotheca rogersii TaxID=419775 RepID=UPI00221E7DE4|nr:putative cytochrome P450 [Durotheca rogersii]KAI5865331.1 putative cytochrome P450 [Durotheca rogersii]